MPRMPYVRQGTCRHALQASAPPVQRLAGTAPSTLKGSVRLLNSEPACTVEVFEKALLSMQTCQSAASLAKKADCFCGLTGHAVSHSL